MRQMLEGTNDQKRSAHHLSRRRTNMDASTHFGR